MENKVKLIKFILFVKLWKNMINKCGFVWIHRKDLFINSSLHIWNQSRQYLTMKDRCPDGIVSWDKNWATKNIVTHCPFNGIVPVAWVDFWYRNRRSFCSQVKLEYCSPKRLLFFTTCRKNVKGPQQIFWAKSEKCCGFKILKV